jgi:PhzF family phenazine biosynthesis protein
MTVYQVDAFADRIFEGNPAGVCLLSGAADEAWMQNVAMEMNLSETAFLYPTEGGYNLRWFTPKAEVKLCGHATLASAHILRETGRLGEGGTAVFFTLSGKLSATCAGGAVTLDFPARECRPVDDAPAIERALGAPARFVGCNGMDYLAELESEAAVRGVEPDMGAIVRAGARGVIVTARASTPGFDFVSRFFAPAVGIPEDPVTGSAHCCLGPYWRDRLGKTVFSAYQASRRGGKLAVEARGDRVFIGGRAVTVFAAEMAVASSQ